MEHVIPAEAVKVYAEFTDTDGARTRRMVGMVPEGQCDETHMLTIHAHLLECYVRMTSRCEV